MYLFYFAWDVVNPGISTCFAYAKTLNKILSSMNAGEARLMIGTFITDQCYVHSLVEYYNENQQSWMLLDPTFNLSMKTTTDG